MNKNGTTKDEIRLSENEYVKELFNILKENGKDITGLAAIISHVGEMESFVQRAENKIVDMKSQLDTMKEIQNHPFKTYLQNTIKTLEIKVEKVKETLGKLKENIIKSCKSAVTAFKEKGISALANIADFFKIKQGLEDWKKDINSLIRSDDKAINKIEAFSKEYHSAGRAVKNMARVAIGKEPLNLKKEAGIFSKALAAPYKNQKAMLIGLKKALNKAIKKLEQLEKPTEIEKPAEVEKSAEVKEPVEVKIKKTAALKKTATVKRAGTYKRLVAKPSLIKKLDQNKERVKQAKRDIPPQNRARVKGAEL